MEGFTELLQGVRKEFTEGKTNENSEFTYYPIFESFLRRKGCTKVTTSVKYRYGEIDIVGLKEFKTVPSKLYTIEVKMSDWRTVMIQAHRRSFFSNYSYFALIYKDLRDLSYFMYMFGKNFSKLEDLKLNYRVGVLIYDLKRNSIIEVLTALQNKNPSILYKKAIINEAFGEQNKL